MKLVCSECREELEISSIEQMGFDIKIKIVPCSCSFDPKEVHEMKEDLIQAKVDLCNFHEEVKEVIARYATPREDEGETDGSTNRD